MKLIRGYYTLIMSSPQSRSPGLVCSKTAKAMLNAFYKFLQKLSHFYNKKIVNADFRKTVYIFKFKAVLNPLNQIN